MTLRHVLFCLVHIACVTDLYQFFKGLFRGPLVLRTFAAHFTAINGTIEIAGWKDEPARSGLVLAAAAVSSHNLMCR